MKQYLLSRRLARASPSAHEREVRRLWASSHHNDRGSSSGFCAGSKAVVVGQQGVDSVTSRGTLALTSAGVARLSNACFGEIDAKFVS